MSRDKVIAKNVLAFLEKAARLHGKSEEEKFQQEMYSNFVDLGMESPIEHMFWVACQAQCAAHYQPINPDPIVDENLTARDGFGIHIVPQARIGKYRVDFLMHQVGVIPDGVATKVVIELDGHAFHDKDKRQRSYEKARDRFFVRAGYRVLHFTGSDVVADPFMVAHEALDMLGVFDDVDTRYDAHQPLGVE